VPGNWSTYLAGSSYLRLREFPASRLVITAVVIGPETAVALVQLRRPAIFRPMPLKPGDSPRYIRHLHRRRYMSGFSAKTAVILGTLADRMSGSPIARHCASRHLPDPINVRFIDGKHMRCSLHGWQTGRMAEPSSTEVRLIEEKIGA